ncbi:RNA ligase RtcB family protein [Undibacterium sp. TJN19]|uniref:RNA ligase RtcB family protein n=1 Tax=Undibacterium sp. TJN19 TaxID=3413055 RepID=UPI003BF28537
MGNFIQQLSERVSMIASDRLWLEDAAIEQLKTTAQLTHMVSVVGLPDLHPGRGYPVGAAFLSKNHFYPALVGNDIGCGMSLYQTDLAISKVRLDKLDKQIGNLDQPLDDDEWLQLLAQHPELTTEKQTLVTCLQHAGLDLLQLRSLGTIGGGNHFAELQITDSVEDTPAFTTAGLQKKQVQLLVHSGSRGLGQFILRQHVDAYSHAGLASETDAAADYLRKHDAALMYAALNRKLIVARLLRRMRCKGELVLDVHHNLVTPLDVDGQRCWLHRKGASPSDQGLVMLPGSRGDYSYLLQPHIQNAASSLHSLAHGAGRKWQRTDCKDRLFKLATPEQLSRTDLGSRVICEDKALIYEEAPQAYKNLDSVLDCLVSAGLATVIARSKPLLTYKTRGECC